LGLSPATLVTATISDSGRVVAGPLAVSVRGTTLPGWSGSFVLPAGSEFEEGGEYQFEAVDSAPCQIVIDGVRTGPTGARVYFTAAGRFGRRGPGRDGAAASDETLVADLRAGRTTAQHLQQKLRGLLRGGAAGHFIRASHCPDGRPRSPAV
jgi:hypothetical protein